MFDTQRNRIARAARRFSRPKILRRFVRHEDGATAIEFAFVAVPFFAITFAIMETALVFFAGQVLETATADSARKIMTGQAQTQGWSQTEFKKEVCSRVVALFDCAGGIHVDVKTYSAFTDANMSKPIDANGNLVNNFTYQPGGPGDVVVVRMLYEWPVYVSLLGLNLADMGSNKRLLVATAAFRNEPYQ